MLERGGGEEKEKAQCRRLQQRSDGGRSGALTGKIGENEETTNRAGLAGRG